MKDMRKKAMELNIQLVIFILALIGMVIAIAIFGGAGKHIKNLIESILRTLGLG